MKKILTLPLYRPDGTHSELVELPLSVFARPVSDLFLAKVMRIYQANLRQGTAMTKDRGDVGRTKAKIYRQKGTGRARHGARSAPIFVGGGVTHGPSGTQNYQLKLSKTMKRRAVTGALTQKFTEQKLIVVQSLSGIKGKTKEALAWLENLNIGSISKLLILTDKVESGLILSTANIKNVTVSQVRRTNAYEVMQAHRIVLTQDAIQVLAQGKI